jgi:hypothetical protein
MIFEYMYDALLYMVAFGAIVVLFFSLILMLMLMARVPLRALLSLLRR